MSDSAPLKLFNSLTRRLEDFQPVHPGEARVYSCGPTVYNYPHIGNMRAYVFADVLGRTLSFKGYRLTHVINITDVGHLTDDADAGEDKLEKAAKTDARSIWDIAAHYTEAYWADIAALNIRQPAEWSIATKYISQMIEFARRIAPVHCYELASGLYFDVSTVADYGRLARAETEEGEGRIESVDGKRHPADFAIWRKTPLGEKRQMEWDSPWGRGAPGWHLECSVMSEQLLGFPFDIHTGGIDHREIHHPNEIAQNQAFCGCGGLDVPAHSGARIWMHNNFLVERSGKMSKSSGEFLRLQLLIDKGYHPLAYRLMCLQAHYRSELEFSWEGLGAAMTRLKRLVMACTKFPQSSLNYVRREFENNKFELRQKIKSSKLLNLLEKFDNAISDDLNTPVSLTFFEEVIKIERELSWRDQIRAIILMDSVLGLGILETARTDLRIKPKIYHNNNLDDADIDVLLAARKVLKKSKEYKISDEIRDTLQTSGVEVMDGDPLGWDWRIG